LLKRRLPFMRGQALQDFAPSEAASMDRLSVIKMFPRIVDDPA